MGLTLPRLIALLGYTIALLGAIPLFPHLPLLPRLIFLIGLATGLVTDRRVKPLVPHLVLTVSSLLWFFWYAAQFSRANPVLPVVSILMVLLGTRLAAGKTPRTWLQTCGIALFCLSASSLFDLGPRFLLFLTLMLPMLAMMLVALTFQQAGAQSLGRSSLRQIVMVGLALPLFALLLTPLFFPILPRTQLPLWNFLQQSGGSQPAGLSDTVTPGSTPQVSASGLLVFRAELPRQEPRSLYWRGHTFSRLEGLQWRKDLSAPPLTPPAGVAQITQIITMEPGSSRALLGLDLPLSFAYQNGSSIPSATWNRPLPSSRRIRYGVISATGGLLVGPPPVTQRLTLLPDATPLRLRQQAARLRQAGSTDQQRLDALENWFRTNGFRYSRTNLPTGADALERFLFDTKSGHCEFFASGFALLARGAGLPARLVGGYYGGEYNELGGYYRVSEERAHVWVEIWINGAGWLRYDPSSLAVNADTALGEPRQRSLAMRLRLLLDSLDHSWNSAIIAYDFERQLQMASSAHSRLQTLRLRNLNGLPLLLGLLLAAAGLIWLVLRLRRRGLFDRKTWLLRRFRLLLERDCAIPRTMPLGLFDILSRTTNRQVHEFVSIYARSLYHQSPLTPADYRRLKQLLRHGFL
jgi:hypothetical protein